MAKAGIEGISRGRKVRLGAKVRQGLLLLFLSGR